MSHKRAVLAVLAAAHMLGLSTAAQACSDPSEEWYRDVSDVVFDALARCDPEARSCELRVTDVRKNTLHLALERQAIEVDYQNWFTDYYADEANANTIILTCGVPVFEPSQHTFRARFYANLDAETSELVVRRYQIRGASGARDE